MCLVTMASGLVQKLLTWWHHLMETLSALLVFCEGNRPVIPLTKAGDAELWCLPRSAPQLMVEQTMGTLVIWDTIAQIMASLQWVTFLYLIGIKMHLNTCTCPSTRIYTKKSWYCSCIVWNYMLVCVTFWLYCYHILQVHIDLIRGFLFLFQYIHLGIALSHHRLWGWGLEMHSSTVEYHNITDLPVIRRIFYVSNVN